MSASSSSFLIRNRALTSRRATSASSRNTNSLLATSPGGIHDHVVAAITERRRHRAGMPAAGDGEAAPAAPRRRPTAAFMEMLAQRMHLIAPTHPGFGNSPLPEWIDSVDDLAYLYLDLLDQL